MRQQRDFSRVLTTGERVQTKLFRVYTAPGQQSEARLGIVVSKKVVAKAVVRNRIRRLVREAFRRRQGNLAALDVVVLARTSQYGDSRRALAELGELFSRFGSARTDTQ